MSVNALLNRLAIVLLLFIFDFRFTQFVAISNGGCGLAVFY